MSCIKPARRWQPRFYPFKRESFRKRFREKIEIMLKGPLWGCRMCGNCLLQETAFICCMECPKGLRNGPCGGVIPDGHCYVDPTRRCVWHAIYNRARKTGRTDTLIEVLPPLDWSRTGGETWADVISQIGKVGSGKFFGSLFSRDREYRKQVWDSVFMTIRQPAWWNGDREYHPAAYTEPASELERSLREGRFVVATEITPPLSSDTEKLRKAIEEVRPYVQAINFTDASSAIPRMSALACCKVATDLNAEPVFQITARDSTRLSLQGDAIGAGQFGIRNILCITGDSPLVGNPPISDMNIYDLDAVQMLWILRRMRDEGIYLDGRKMKHPPRYFLGAATTPGALDPELQAIRDQKKVNAGAQFFQTNIIFDAEKLDPWLEQLDKRNVLGKVSILAGLAPLKSYKTALYLHEKVPGVYLPDKILNRMEKAGDGAREEGIAIALELIASLKRKKGISGIHLMTLGGEDIIGRIVREAGLDR
ncbi:MAG: methylenetetrahydrofolate reductase C-terminal domain-containing protein [Bacteroidales bacterium]|jgi:methylenetetrahydrofolate reductase (NADPH)|nr:methylenetetrahydrofolate reductase C-terminal domain-containing protein [Bacteroidales bacterium]MBP7038168.1 methylenetetrahydrofolate reductase C-terminal domain-containing protein [Bacteroidales bacterium]